MIRAALHTTLHAVRSVVHAVLALASTFTVLCALVPAAVSVVLARLAYWVCRDPMFSNCWTWAANKLWTLTREWVADGMPKGWEPRMLLRWSRSVPRWLLHVLVGLPVTRGSDELLLESFKPDTPDDAPGWRAVLHLLFLGRVQKGDGYHSVPPR